MKIKDIFDWEVFSYTLILIIPIFVGIDFDRKEGWITDLESIFKLLTPICGTYGILVAAKIAFYTQNKSADAAKNATSLSYKNREIKYILDNIKYLIDNISVFLSLLDERFKLKVEIDKFRVEHFYEGKVYNTTDVNEKILLEEIRKKIYVYADKLRIVDLKIEKMYNRLTFSNDEIDLKEKLKK